MHRSFGQHQHYGSQQDHKSKTKHQGYRRIIRECLVEFTVKGMKQQVLQDEIGLPYQQEKDHIFGLIKH